MWGKCQEYLRLPVPAASASSTFPGMCLCVRAERVRSRSRGRARCQVYFRRWGFELFKMHIVCVHLTKENASSECPGLLVCQMMKSSSPPAQGSLSMVLWVRVDAAQLEATLDLSLALQGTMAS